MEHASPDALKEYLKEHPNADPKNHSVKDNTDSDAKATAKAVAISDGVSAKSVKAMTEGSEKLKKLVSSGGSGREISQVASKVMSDLEYSLKRPIYLLEKSKADGSLDKDSQDALKAFSKVRSEYDKLSRSLGIAPNASEVTRNLESVLKLVEKTQKLHAVGGSKTAFEKTASLRDAQEELRQILAYCCRQDSELPSRAVVAARLRNLADRIA